LSDRRRALPCAHLDPLVPLRSRAKAAIDFELDVIAVDVNLGHLYDITHARRRPVLAAHLDPFGFIPRAVAREFERLL
jgi:hypothetical protein